MKFLVLLSAALCGVSAYPSVVQRDPIYDSDEEVAKRDSPAIQLSKSQTNCGFFACKTFKEEQRLSVTGKHAYASPLITQIRGPCPGLNAAANHGYLPRSGIMTVDSTVNGVYNAYYLTKAFNAFLAAYSIIMVGDITTMTWSIGGPQPYGNLGGALYPPQGISYSHNKYEGDVSIGRNDAYMANGDAHSLNMTRFLYAFESGMDDNRYTMHKFRVLFRKNVFRSIAQNPYYFSPPFAGAAVAPAAYNFVINFMSNHTKEEPSGYLDAYNFKKFFAIKGTYPNFKWMKGQEQIPENWYRREKLNPYGAFTTGADVGVGWAAYPDGFRVGGNSGKTNSYTGVSLKQFSGGQFTKKGLTGGSPQDAGCFIFLAAQEAIPDEIKGGVNSLAAATKLFEKFGGPILKKFGCSKLGQYDSSVFEDYPGRNYNPTGRATNY